MIFAVLGDGTIGVAGGAVKRAVVRPKRDETRRTSACAVSVRVLQVRLTLQNAVGIFKNRPVENAWSRWNPNAS
jgi:hypothetical protein